MYKNYNINQFRDSLLQLAVLLCTFILTACGGGESTISESPNALSKDTSEISSSITNITYRLDVFLPHSYTSDGDALPVIYSGDGQWSSDIYSKALQKKEVQAILVSIHEGPSGRRNIDYLTPGVYNYFEFLTQELIPFIESKYNASSDNRTIVGHSFGGAMSVYSMIIDDTENQYFSNYVAADPIIPDFDKFVIDEDDRYQLSTTMNANFIVTVATIGKSASGIRVYNDLIEHLLNRNYQGLTIQHSDLRVDHGAANLDTFELALTKLFPVEN